MSQRYLIQTPLGFFDQNKNRDNVKNTLQIPLLSICGMPMIFSRQQRSHLGWGVKEASPNKNIFLCFALCWTCSLLRATLLWGIPVTQQLQAEMDCTSNEIKYVGKHKLLFLEFSIMVWLGILFWYKSYYKNTIIMKHWIQIKTNCWWRTGWNSLLCIVQNTIIHLDLF